MKPNYSGQKELPTQAAEAAQEAIEAGLPQINGKQAVACSRVKHPSQPAVNFYVLEDGIEVMQNDGGETVTEWPELPPHVIAKRAEKET